MKFDWSVYKNNVTWLQANTIYLTVHGSRSYGTNTPESDLDVRGVAIPPKEYLLGYLQGFDQAEQNEPDITVFGLKKFMGLAADCNPNVIEVLFTDEEDKLFVSPLGRTLLDHREDFLSKKVKHTFSGYAISQLHRLKRHYDWHRHPRTEPPTRKEFGLPDRAMIPKDQLDAANSAIQKKLDEWSVHFLNAGDAALRIEVLEKMREYLSEIHVSMQGDLWIGAARILGFETNFIEVLDKERRFLAAKREWDQYLAWKRDRNPKRAELEAKYGYDCKHAYHLVRLLRMCREILVDQKVLVKRPDREELLEIRNGGWTYERLVEWAEKEEAGLSELYKTSTLRNEPDRDRLNALCIEMTEKSLSGSK